MACGVIFCVFIFYFLLFFYMLTIYSSTLSYHQQHGTFLCLSLNHPTVNVVHRVCVNSNHLERLMATTKVQIFSCLQQKLNVKWIFFSISYLFIFFCYKTYSHLLNKQKEINIKNKKMKKIKYMYQNATIDIMVGVLTGVYVHII